MLGKVLISTLSLLATGWTSLALGNDQSASTTYGVQVGVYKNYNDNLANKLEALGEVFTYQHTGLTTVIIGNHQDKADVNSVLTTAREMGFTDAFIKTHPLDYPHTSAASEVGFNETDSNGLSSNQMSKLDSLSADDRDRVVILNGELYFKDGETFTPVQ